MCRANETYYVDGFSYYSSKTDTNLIRENILCSRKLHERANRVEISLTT